jgi:hypothetical protein
VIDWSGSTVRLFVNFTLSLPFVVSGTLAPLTFDVMTNGIKMLTFSTSPLVLTNESLKVPLQEVISATIVSKQILQMILNYTTMYDEFADLNIVIQGSPGVNLISDIIVGMRINLGHPIPPRCSGADVTSSVGVSNISSGTNGKASKGEDASKREEGGQVMGSLAVNTQSDATWVNMTALFRLFEWPLPFDLRAGAFHFETTTGGLSGGSLSASECRNTYGCSVAYTNCNGLHLVQGDIRPIEMSFNVTANDGGVKLRAQVIDVLNGKNAVFIVGNGDIEAPVSWKFTNRSDGKGITLKIDTKTLLGDALGGGRRMQEAVVGDDGNQDGEQDGEQDGDHDARKEGPTLQLRRGLVGDERDTNGTSGDGSDMNVGLNDVGYEGGGLRARLHRVDLYGAEQQGNGTLDLACVLTSDCPNGTSSAQTDYFSLKSSVHIALGFTLPIQLSFNIPAFAVDVDLLVDDDSGIESMTNGGIDPITGKRITRPQIPLQLARFTTDEFDYRGSSSSSSSSSTSSSSSSSSSSTQMNNGESELTVGFGVMTKRFYLLKEFAIQAYIKMTEQTMKIHAAKTADVSLFSSLLAVLEVDYVINQPSAVDIDRSSAASSGGGGRRRQQQQQQPVDGSQFSLLSQRRLDCSQGVLGTAPAATLALAAEACRVDVKCDAFVWSSDNRYVWKCGCDDYTQGDVDSMMVPSGTGTAGTAGAAGAAGAAAAAAASAAPTTTTSGFRYPSTCAWNPTHQAAGGGGGGGVNGNSTGGSSGDSAASNSLKVRPEMEWGLDASLSSSPFQVELAMHLTIDHYPMSFGVFTGNFKGSMYMVDLAAGSRRVLGMALNVCSADPDACIVAELDFAPISIMPNVRSSTNITLRLVSPSGDGILLGETLTKALEGQHLGLWIRGNSLANVARYGGSSTASGPTFVKREIPIDFRMALPIAPTLYKPLSASQGGGQKRRRTRMQTKTRARAMRKMRHREEEGGEYGIGTTMEEEIETEEEAKTKNKTENTDEDEDGDQEGGGAENEYENEYKEACEEEFRWQDEEASKEVILDGDAKDTPPAILRTVRYLHSVLTGRKMRERRRASEASEASEASDAQLALANSSFALKSVDIRSIDTDGTLFDVPCLTADTGGTCVVPVTRLNTDVELGLHLDIIPDNIRLKLDMPYIAFSARAVFGRWNTTLGTVSLTSVAMGTGGSKGTSAVGGAGGAGGGGVAMGNGESLRSTHRARIRDLRRTIEMTKV